MVGGAAGGVHWAGHGCPRYAQVRGTELPNLAGFQPALFPIVLRLLCPLFFRALCCAARGSAKDLSQKISIPCGDRTVGCGRSRPCLSLYLHCSLQPNAAVRQPCSGQTPWWHEINREIQGVGAIPRPPRRCDAPLPPPRSVFLAPRSGSQQRSASGCSAGPDGRSHPSRIKSLYGKDLRPDRQHADEQRE